MALNFHDFVEEIVAFATVVMKDKMVVVFVVTLVILVLPQAANFIIN